MSRGPEGPGGPNQNEPIGSGRGGGGGGLTVPCPWAPEGPIGSGGPSLFLVHGPPRVLQRLCVRV